MTGLLRQALADRSVRWLAAARVVALAAAPVSLYLLVTRQPLSARGFYLIAINLVALAQLFETGVGTLVVQCAARAGPADLGYVRGAADEWFTRAAFFFLAIAGVVGSYVLATGASSATVAFLLPWGAVVALTTVYIRLVPLICLREGAGGVEAVQRMRAVQAAAVAAATMLGLRFGSGIAAAAWASVAQLGVAALFVVAWRAELPSPTASAGSARAESYRREQGRSAQVWLALWLAPQVLTPATMYLHGASAAGDVGLHVALALAPPVLSVAWMHARYPRLGALVASGNLHRFDHTARHSLVQALWVFGASSIALLVLAIVGPHLLPFLAGRVLSAPMLITLLAGTLMLVVMQAMLAWFRAFGDERLARPVVVACAAMGAGAISGSAIGGALGASLGFSSVGVVVTAILGAGFFRLRAQRLGGA
ncbi:MAG: hypothetical protein IT356_01965 [Gemmatimonadaceae bacterium]|nr:hypothetical protein [Gemmatimonadaceae bacterium]